MPNRELRVFGRVNGLDFLLVLVVLLSGFGFLLARAGMAGVNNQISGIARVSIDVFIIGLKTEDVNLFKVGDKAAFTVRNQPVYPPMTIDAVKHWPKQVPFLATNGKSALAVNDPTQPFAHDFLVTVSDEAEISRDGYVVRGNKIKVGNQVELEGFKYRVQGVIVDIHRTQ